MRLEEIKRFYTGLAFVTLLVVVSIGVGLSSISSTTEYVAQEQKPVEAEIAPPSEVQIWVEKEVTVTAYSEIDSCHYENCVMASGKRAYVGAVACPRDIELATEVIIGGVSYTCEDRTARRYDGRYDVFFGYGKESHEQALAFGIQKIKVQRQYEN